MLRKHVSLNSILVLCLQIENSPHDFALYIIHVSGGKPDITVGSFHFCLSSVCGGGTALLGVTGFITGICPCSQCSIFVFLGPLKYVRFSDEEENLNNCVLGTS